MLVVLFLLSFGAVAAAQDSTSVLSVDSLAFVQRDGRSLYLDVYRPVHPRADRACVVYLFGGGFYNGARNDSESRETCAALTARGFVAVSVDYRLGLRETDMDTVGLFTLTRPFERSINWAVEDCCAAVAYLCAHADDLGIDTSKIVLTGSSAGAITVLQADYCRANHLAQASVLPSGFRPLAVVTYSGALLLRRGKLRYETPPAPTCLFHGTKDKIVNYNCFGVSTRQGLRGSSKVVKTFKRNNYPYWIMRFEGRGHEVCHYLPFTLDEFTAFVDAAAAGRRTHYDATCSDDALPTTPYTNMTIWQLYSK